MPGATRPRSPPRAGKPTCSRHPTGRHGSWTPDMGTKLTPAVVEHQRNYNIRDPGGFFAKGALVALSGVPESIAQDPDEGVALVFMIVRTRRSTVACSVKWRVTAPATGEAVPQSLFQGGAYPSGTATFQPGQTATPGSIGIAAGPGPTRR